MSYCSQCGVQLPEGAPACPQCAATRPGPITRAAAPDRPSGGAALFAFFVPLVGFALWYAWRQQSPQRARSARRGAVIGTIVGALGYLVATVIYFAAIASVMKGIH